MKEEIPYRNRNRTGWWIASIIMRFEYFDEDTVDLDRSCKVWENLTLVEANDREDAYQKAVELGKAEETGESWDQDTGRRGSFKFEGFSLLLPVYEDLSHGAEILWTEHENISVKQAKAMVLPKNELGCFDDTPDEE